MIRQVIYKVVAQIEADIEACKILARREIDYTEKAAINGEKTGLMIARDMIRRELKAFDEGEK